MTTELLEIMRADIKRCEDAQESSNGTHSLYQALIAKYNGIFEDFGKDIPTSGKACAVGSALNYRPELNAIKEKLELIIATDKEITNYLRHHSRSYIFTASITPASTAAVNAALDIMLSEPERQQNLWDLTNFALENFKAMGCEIGHTSTPIIPLYIRDDYKTFQVTRDLLDEGVFVNPVVSPAVAPNDTLIRYSLMATHTKEQVTRSLEAIEKVFKANGVLK